MKNITKKHMEEKLNKTAVQWLADYLGISNGDALENALQMERIQIIYAYDDGANERHNDPVTGEEYYKETYKNE